MDKKKKKLRRHVQKKDEQQLSKIHGAYKVGACFMVCTKYIGNSRPNVRQ